MYLLPSEIDLQKFNNELKIRYASYLVGYFYYNLLTATTRQISRKGSNYIISINVFFENHQ